MTFRRVLIGSALVAGVVGCSPFETPRGNRTFTFDYIGVDEAVDHIRPYLSSEGRLFLAETRSNVLTVQDNRNVLSRIDRLVDELDAAPQTVTLRFQVVRASERGSADPALRAVAGALRDLVRFEGYELVAQALMTASERRDVEQVVGSEATPLQLAVKIEDIRSGYGDRGSVDLSVELRGLGKESLLSTNVVIPLGQTVVLGSAYPGGSGDALILTVRPEMGSRELAAATRMSNRSSRAAEEQLHQLEAKLRELEHARGLHTDSVMMLADSITSHLDLKDMRLVPGWALHDKGVGKPIEKPKPLGTRRLPSRSGPGVVPATVPPVPPPG